jgi:hypothetical protein
MEPVLAREAVMTAPDDMPEPPARSASKAEWVEHAVDRGEERGTAEAATKAELIERHG